MRIALDAQKRKPLSTGLMNPPPDEGGGTAPEAWGRLIVPRTGRLHSARWAFCFLVGPAIVLPSAALSCRGKHTTETHMSRAYSDIAFTPAVRALQTRMGSRSAYAAFDHAEDRRHTLTEHEAGFIRERDGFYQATVSETGWPYVQYRGGPAGFLKVLDASTLAYGDFRGNRQYISVGNLGGNDRISLMLMDYASRQRLKILGRVRLVSEAEDPALMAQLRLPGYRAQVERAFVIDVEAFDWNCPQHITPRFTEAEIEQAVQPLRAELEQLHLELARLRAASAHQP